MSTLHPFKDFHFNSPHHQSCRLLVCFQQKNILMRIFAKLSSQLIYHQLCKFHQICWKKHHFTSNYSFWQYASQAFSKSNCAPQFCMIKNHQINKKSSLNIKIEETKELNQIIFGKGNKKTHLLTLFYLGYLEQHYGQKYPPLYFLTSSEIS